MAYLLIYRSVVQGLELEAISRTMSVSDFAIGNEETEVPSNKIDIEVHWEQTDEQIMK